MNWNPKDVLDTCPYCWREPCVCAPGPCEKCLEKDREIEKLKNLLALAGVGY